MTIIRTGGVSADDYFSIIPEAVLYADISDKALRLYGVLRRYADKNTLIGHPGQSKLAEHMRCSVPSVKRATAELEELGVIRVERRFEPGNPTHKLPNRYHILTLPKLTSELTPEETEVMGELTPPVTSEPTPEVMGELLTRVIKPESFEPEKSLVQNRVVDDLFEAFWEIYPRRTGKIKAREAFIKALQMTTPTELLEAARNYRDDVNRDPGFTKHPTTWLNQGCWDDDPLPARSSPKGVTAVEMAAQAMRSARSPDQDKGPVGVKEFIDAALDAVKEVMPYEEARRRGFGSNPASRIPQHAHATGNG